MEKLLIYLINSNGKIFTIINIDYEKIKKISTTFSLYIYIYISSSSTRVLKKKFKQTDLNI